jgi:hypothetical protein
MLPRLLLPRLLASTSPALSGSPALLLTAPARAAPVVASASVQGSYFLSRQIFLHWLGGVFLVANLVALRQNKALIGGNGITPVSSWIARGRAGGSGFWQRPSCFWWLPIEPSPRTVDRWLDAHAILGLLLAVPLTLTGAGSACQLFLLWALYTSLSAVGQAWYSFGWETLLVETSFIAIFLCPLRPWTPAGAAFAPPAVGIWACRWLLFRIMIGAGLIKLRSSDPCWKDLTAMDSHYETQPIPNPLSRRLHFAPKAWHRIETWVGLWLVEIIAPFLLLVPGGGVSALGALGAGVRRSSALLQIVFQFVLIQSGNLAFLNWLTIAPALMCIDDGLWRRLLPGLGQWAPPAVTSPAAASTAAAALHTLPQWLTPTAAIQLAFAALIARASIPVVANLCSSGQRMNSAFGPWRLVNSYGAFGTVTKRRFEVEIQGTRDEMPTADAAWRPYEFVAKPGDPKRAPRWLSPYHLRLDWLAWFLPFSSWRSSAWLAPFVRKLLENDERVSALLARDSGNPFLADGGGPPKWVRGVLYEYKFARDRGPGGDYWTREFCREWMPPQSKERGR